MQGGAGSKVTSLLRGVNFIENGEPSTGNETCVSGREPRGNTEEGLGHGDERAQRQGALKVSGKGELELT